MTSRMQWPISRSRRSDDDRSTDEELRTEGTGAEVVASAHARSCRTWRRYSISTAQFTKRLATRSGLDLPTSLGSHPPSLGRGYYQYPPDVVGVVALGVDEAEITFRFGVAMKNPWTP